MVFGAAPSATRRALDQVAHEQWPGAPSRRAAPADACGQDISQPGKLLASVHGVEHGTIGRMDHRTPIS